MATAAGQRLKLEMSMQSFERNLERMRQETIEEVNSVLKTGASAYATSAQKHTPPSLGKPEIDPSFYVDGVKIDSSDEMLEPPHGRRQVLDLVELARSRVRFASHYGKLARQGYRFLVRIIRLGRKPVWKPCRTESEAERYAREDYRGLTRAAWGLQFSMLTGKVPPAFRKYISKRPAIANMARLNKVTMDAAKHEVTIVNHAIPTGAAFLASTDTNASIAAVRSMDDRMNKFFKRKYEL